MLYRRFLFYTFFFSLVFLCVSSKRFVNAYASLKPFVDDNRFPIEVIVPNTSLPHELLGIGVQFDPYFFSHNVPMENGVTEADWDRIIVPRVKSMRIQRYRIGILPHWWEPYNDDSNPHSINEDGFTWNSPDMNSLYHVLDLAEETGADVNLVLWGCPIGASLSTGKKEIQFIGKYFLADNGTNWVTGPNDIDEFAENFVSLVKHLIRVKGYSCIKEITPFNEPEGRVVDIDNYIKCVKAIDFRLKQEGLRDVVLINGADNMGPHIALLKTYVDSLSTICDLYNSHTYSFGYKSKNEDIFNWELQNVQITSSIGSVHFVGEFGSDELIGAARQADIDAYERGVLLSRLAINFLNAGAVGVSYWCLDDHFMNAASNYASMQQLGLWRSISSIYTAEGYYSDNTEDYYARPQYYAYSLLTRSIRKGDLVYPLFINNDYIAGTALFHKNKKWTYLFANGSNEPKSIELIPNHHIKSGLKIYEYRKNSLPCNGKQISVSHKLNRNKKGSYVFNLPSNSVLVLSE